MVYQEIVEGCSFCPKGFFVKHLCDLEQIELTRKRIEFISKYVEGGIPTEEERLKQVIDSGEWSEEKEGDILAYRMTLLDNEKMFSTVIPIQQSAIRKAIEQTRNELIKLLMAKKLAVGTTAEELADRDGSYYTGFLSIFSDRACTQRLFATWEDFESLAETKQEEYNKAIEDTLAKFSELNVRKIAALPFFLNPFSYSKEAIHTFVDKPMCRLTNFQIHLFSLGSRNINILSQAEGSPPEYFEKTSAEEVAKWYDSQYSIIIGKRKQANHS